mmetsp:Transcript_119621/g.338628  ORF Transcript_119621/g.338628 Transcript_119621/m.338628 type:complete len:217 (+) Transcript_119621:712-1362(+)
MTAARGGGDEPKRCSIGANGIPVGCSSTRWLLASPLSCSHSIPMLTVPTSMVPGTGSTSMVMTPSAVVSSFCRTVFFWKSWQLVLSAAWSIRWLCRSRFNCRSAADTSVKQATRSSLTPRKDSNFRPLKRVANSCVAVASPSGKAPPTFASKFSDHAWCCLAHWCRIRPSDAGMDVICVIPSESDLNSMCHAVSNQRYARSNKESTLAAADASGNN